METILSKAAMTVMRFSAAGDDVLSGNAGADTLFGGDGNDIIHGQIAGARVAITRPIRLLWRGGQRSAFGEGGRDILDGARRRCRSGDAGNDQLYGGAASAIGSCSAAMATTITGWMKGQQRP
jgi:Ca2+-binding RTX toxin-like protein